MEYMEAADLVRRLRYKPEWTFAPVPRDAYSWQNYLPPFYSYAEEESKSPIMKIRAYGSVRDTDPVNAPDYKRVVTGHHEFEIDLSQIHTETDFYRAVWDAFVVPFEEHEQREWFKVRLSDGRLESPFHPHTDDGQTRFLKRIHIPLALRESVSSR